MNILAGFIAALLVGCFLSLFWWLAFSMGESKGKQEGARMASSAEEWRDFESDPIKKQGECVGAHDNT